MVDAGSTERPIAESEGSIKPNELPSVENKARDLLSGINKDSFVSFIKKPLDRPLVIIPKGAQVRARVQYITKGNFWRHDETDVELENDLIGSIEFMRVENTRLTQGEEISADVYIGRIIPDSPKLLGLDRQIQSAEKNNNQELASQLDRKRKRLKQQLELAFLDSNPSFKTSLRDFEEIIHVEFSTEFPGMRVKPSSAIPPERKYSLFLSRYTELTNRIRRLNEQIKGRESIGTRQQDKIKEYDEQRHKLHLELQELGQSLGKSEHEVFYDLLLTEGSLIEYGVDAPILKIPTIHKGDNSMIHQVSTPEGEQLAEAFFIARTGNMKFEGDQTEIQKWDEKPYFVIVFTGQKGRGIVKPKWPLHDTRTQRMQNLARDLKLNIYSFEGTLVHDRDPIFQTDTIQGVEVSAERILEVARAMREHPEKYWLTEEERRATS